MATRTSRAAILLMAILAIGASGCDRTPTASKQEKGDASGPVTGGTWIVGSIGDASTLLPLLATDSASQDIIGLVFCSLLRYGPDYEVLGDAAERYEILDGGLRIRIHLRKNVRWHDGEPVTVDDLVFTRQVALDPKTPTPYRSSFEAISELRKVDAYTADYVYETTYAPALNDLVGAAGSILPRHLLEGKDLLTSPLQRNPVGCGPYRFRRWEAKREIELVANNDWHRGRPNIDRYVYRIIPDQATMFLELMNFGIDQMGLRPQQYARQTAAPRFRDNFRKFRYTGFNYTYLGYNLTRPLFQDIRVRRAIGHAIDREAILKGVNFGLGQVATGPYRPGMWYYKQVTADPAYDPGTAKDLLAAAGYTDHDGDGVIDRNGVPFKFEIVTNQGNLQRKQVAEIIQDSLRKLGIEVSIRIVEWSAFLEEFIYKKRFDAVILGWNTGIDPDQYDIWHSSRTGPREFNFVGYRNPEVDELLIAGRRTFDKEQRKAIYGRFQDILAWEQPYTFLYISDSLPAVHNRVRGIRLAEAGIMYNFEDWWIPRAQQGFHHKQ
ncbi:MAG: peptide-binding protein [Candidatus Dadabacteria bacterium]|nr:MAG: peptide-binding protein [Candidatus Dadabacteria bacterium]